MRTIRVPKSVLRAIAQTEASSGSGTSVSVEIDNFTDDDIEFFDVDIKPLRCLWCYTLATDPDEIGRQPRCVSCGKHGVTRLEMRDKRQVYVVEDD